MTTRMAGLKERLQQELNDTLDEIARLGERLETKGDYGLGKGDLDCFAISELYTEATGVSLVRKDKK